MTHCNDQLIDQLLNQAEQEGRCLIPPSTAIRKALLRRTGSAVVSGGPADKAGLKEGDTIVAFNGNAVNNNYSLLGYVRAAALGDKVTLTIVRDGKTMDVDVTLEQEESSVNGASSSDSNGNSQNKQNNQNGNGQNGYGNGNGNSDGGTGDGGGFSDPFGLW